MSDALKPEHAGPEHERSVHRLADYVYGTISTLVAVAGLTSRPTPRH
jgi:hypothetical protein